MPALASCLQNPAWVLDPREKGWSSECVGLWDPSQMEQQIGASHLQTVTFGGGGHILREVEAVLCKTLTKSYFKCKMERNVDIALFARARARARAHTHTHTHTGTSEKKELQVSSIFKAAGLDNSVILHCCHTVAPRKP